MKKILRVFFAICFIALSSVQANEEERKCWHNFTHTTEFGEKVSLNFPFEPTKVVLEESTVFFAIDHGVLYSLEMSPNNEDEDEDETSSDRLEEYLGTLGGIDYRENVTMIFRVIATDKGMYSVMAKYKNDVETEPDYESFFNSIKINNID